MALPKEYADLKLPRRKPPQWQAWVSGAVIAIAAIGMIGWLGIPFIQDFNDDEPSWRSDGIVSEVVRYGEGNRSDTRSVKPGDEDYPWAFQPQDLGEGKCRQPRFRVAEAPERGKTYAAGEEVAITLEYKAPGCTHVLAGFVGEFERGSTWYRQVCPDCTTEHADGKIVSEFVSLTGAHGTVRLVARPGLYEAADPMSVALPPYTPFAPAVDGLRLCQVELRVSDDSGASQSTQTIYLDCHTSAVFGAID